MGADERLIALQKANKARSRKALSELKKRRIDLVAVYHDDMILKYGPPDWMHKFDKEHWYERRGEILRKRAR